MKRFLGLLLLLGVSASIYAQQMPFGGCRSVNAQTGASYTLAASDGNNCVLMSNSAANSITVAANSIAVGSSVAIQQAGTGATTVVAGSGVTFETTASPVAFSGQFSWVVLYEISANTWTVVGVSGASSSGGVSSLTAGQGIAVSASTGAVTVSTTAPERAVTSSPTVESTDMGGQIIANVSGGGTLTIPALSSSIFANGMTLSVVNYSTSPMAISTTPTVNSGGGCSTTNGIPAGATWQFLSNGTTIDCAQTIPGESWLNAASSGTSVTPICLPGMRLTVTTVTATGDLTINAPTGCGEGQQVTLKITYTASITYTWNAVYHANSANPGAIPTTSGDSAGVDFFTFYADVANSRFDYLAGASGF